MQILVLHLIVIMKTILTAQMHVNRLMAQSATNGRPEPYRAVNEAAHQGNGAGIDTQLVMQIAMRFLGMGGLTEAYKKCT